MQLEKIGFLDKESQKKNKEIQELKDTIQTKIDHYSQEILDIKSLMMSERIQKDEWALKFQNNQKKLSNIENQTLS